jgi:hypothetical protein
MAMECNALTYILRTSDGRAFRVPPGTSVMVGREERAGADILFEDRAISRRHSRWFNSGDTCTVECLVNRWWVKVNGIEAPTTGATLKAGDLVELVPGGPTITVEVETASA